VDIQKYCLYYTIFAWEENGSCHLIDYGAFPEQNREYFAYRDVKNVYTGKAEGGYPADLHLALSTFIPPLMNREWITPNGTIMKVDQMLIDANWEPSKNAVYQYCRSSPYGNTVFPSHGRYFGATKTPMSDMAQKQGEKRGNGWTVTYPKTTQSVRYVIVDTNYWKSWIHERISTGMGGDGSMAFFGKEPKAIRMFADQVTAEYVTKVEAKGREVEEWAHNVGKPDNHFFDTACLCAVGASMRGLNMDGEKHAPVQKVVQTKSMSDQIRERRKHRGG
jgi:hypothetical protein